MIPERWAYQDEFETLMVIVGIFGILIVLTLLSTPAPAVPEPVMTEPTGPVWNITYVPEPTATPTLEPTLSEDQMLEEMGGLKMGEWLSWQRYNVSGLKDMSTHTTVYGWKMLGTLDWRSVSWGHYFKMGAGDGMKFLFVYVNTYSDQNMSRMWGVQPDQFRLQIKDLIYEPSTELLPEIRIKQFDETWTLDHVENIKPYGYIRVNEGGKETVMEQGYIKAGRSNAWDGYIVFTVPKETVIKDCKVLAQFGSLVEPHWWQLE